MGLHLAFPFEGYKYFKGYHNGLTPQTSGMYYYRQKFVGKGLGEIEELTKEQFNEVLIKSNN